MRRSDSSTSSTTQTTVNNYDQRSVVDNTGGILGSGNTVTITDGGSVREALGAFVDATGYSMATAQIVARQATDTAAGMLRESLGAMADTTESAFQFSERANNTTAVTTRDTYARALGFAGDAIDSTRATTQSALSAVADAGKRVADAFATARDSDTGNRSLVMVGLIVAGVVGIAALARRG